MAVEGSKFVNGGIGLRIFSQTWENDRREKRLIELTLIKAISKVTVDGQLSNSNKEIDDIANGKEETMGKDAKAEKKDLRSVTTPRGRFSYVILSTAKVNKLKDDDSDTKEYSTVILLPKKKTDLAKIKSAVKAACKEKWGSDESDWPEEMRSPIRDGDAPKFKKKEGYAGHWFIRAKSGEEYPPKLFDSDGDELVDRKEIVSGDYGRMQMYCYAYETKGNSGTAFQLDGVQLIEKGEPLTSRAPVRFDAVDSGEEGEEEESEESEESEEESEGDVDFT